jgi:hypothetical protein
MGKNLIQIVSTELSLDSMPYVYAIRLLQATNHTVNNSGSASNRAYYVSNMALLECRVGLPIY